MLKVMMVGKLLMTLVRELTIVRVAGVAIAWA